MSWTAKRYHDISCGHRVHNHESKCAHLHGHNYRITFHCRASQLDGIGRVIDFSVMKALLCMWLEDNWDHKFLAWTDDPLMNRLSHLAEQGVEGTEAAARNMLFGSLVLVPFNPTAENMARHLVEIIGPQQLKGTGIELVHCDVEETRKCSASYTKEQA